MVAGVGIFRMIMLIAMFKLCTAAAAPIIVPFLASFLCIISPVGSISQYQHRDPTIKNASIEFDPPRCSTPSPAAPVEKGIQFFLFVVKLLPPLLLLCFLLTRRWFVS
jgi:hypothetical protein